MKDKTPLLADNQGLATVEYIILLFGIAVSSMWAWENFHCTLTDKTMDAAFQISHLF